MEAVGPETMTGTKMAGFNPHEGTSAGVDVQELLNDISVVDSKGREF